MYSFLILIIEILICSILKMLGIDPISNFLAGIFILVFSITFSVDLNESQALAKYQKPLFRGYLLRIAFLLFDRFGQSIYHLPNSGADSEVFYNSAVLQAVSTLPGRSSGFIALFRTIFFFIGTNRLIAQFIVLLFSIVALCILAVTIDEIDISEIQKLRAVSIVSILPNFAILSSIFLRESIVMMFITLSFYFFIRYYYGKSYINVLLCFISIILAMYFHSGAVGFILGYLIVLLLNNRNSGEESSRIINTGIAILFGTATIYLYVRYGEVFFQKFLGIDSLSDMANTLEAGGSSYARYVGNSESFGNIIRYTCPRLLFFLFSPFPWQWRGVPDIIAFVFNGMYYFLTIFGAVQYIYSQEQKNRSLAINIMIILACAVFIFAWGVSNTGTAIRHRDKMVCSFAILHAICMNPDRIIHLTADDQILV